MGIEISTPPWVLTIVLQYIAPISIFWRSLLETSVPAYHIKSNHHNQQLIRLNQTKLTYVIIVDPSSKLYILIGFVLIEND